MSSFLLRSTLRGIRSSAPTTARRAFASRASSSASVGACPVTPALRVAVASTLLVSSIYLAGHVQAVDAQYGPRSGLHYYTSPSPSASSSRAAVSSSSAPKMAQSAATFAGLPSTTTRAATGGSFDVAELRCAGILGRALLS